MQPSKTDITNIRSAYYKLNQLESDIAKAEACGIDCEELKRRREAAMKTLRQMNTVYGADHPENM